MSVDTVRSWENGTIPLFAVPYGQLQQLVQALDRAGAQVGTELGDLLLASRCDLLLTGMLHGFEDYAEVPPIEENGAEAESARSLLRWALAGQVPDRYRQHASPRPATRQETTSASLLPSPAICKQDRTGRSRRLWRRSRGPRKPLMASHFRGLATWPRLHGVVCEGKRSGAQAFHASELAAGWCGGSYHTDPHPDSRQATVKCPQMARSGCSLWAPAQ